MADLKQRREEILRELRSEAGRERVIQRLKSLMGLRPDQPLPNGTPIVTTLIRLEQQSRQPSPQS
jgi:hypothetical protein